MFVGDMSRHILRRRKTAKNEFKFTQELVKTLTCFLLLNVTFVTL